MGSHLILSMVTWLIPLLCEVTTTQTDFIITPTSVNATLGSTANFRCSVRTGVPFWLVNGHTVTNLNATDILPLHISPTTIILPIPATEEYNNTNVTCAVLIVRESTQILHSDSVVLQVQGPPAAVSNLTSTNLVLEQVISLTWDAPFTLDITGVDPDISYCVDIRAVAVADNTDSSPLTTNCSVYVPKINFTMDYPNTSTSVIYEFRVTPRNGAGDGPTSAPVYGFFSGPPSRITEDMVEVSVSARDVNLLDVNLTISYEGGIPTGEMPTHLQVLASTLDDYQTNSHFCVTPFTLNSNGMVFIRLNDSSCMPSLAHHRRYKIIITVKNRLGETNSTGDIHISTHEIQTVQADVSPMGGKVYISCTFAGNSRAMGYLSIIHPKVNSSHEMFIVANRRDILGADLNISVDGVPPGNYIVIVFDLVSSGLPVLSPATSPYIRSAGERDNIIVLEPGEDEDDNVVHIDGTLMEVPDPAMNAELQLCISFESSTSGDQIVVLAHHADNPTKLSAYSPPDNRCFRAPTAGSYYFAVFTQKSDNTLEAPATPPEIFIPTLSTFPSLPPQTTPHMPQNAGVAAGVVAGVGSAVVVLLLAIMIVLTVTAVVKSCKKKVETDSEEPYYSTVYTGQPDPIELKENDAYGRPLPVQREIIIEENPAYGVTGQNGTRNGQNYKV